jgi:hypothetical protein
MDTARDRQLIARRRRNTGPENTVYHELLDQGIDPTDNDDYPALDIAKIQHREQWKATWDCPECEREVVEYFDSYPTVEEITAIQDDSICHVCRRKKDDGN